MLHANIFRINSAQVPNYMTLMCHIHFVDKLRYPVQFCLTCDIVCHVRVDGCGNQKRLPFKVLSYSTLFLIIQGSEWTDFTSH